jgi:N6-L-threonylcarbamoyladenine synthase
MKILGIETSCDETSASVVEDGKKVLSNIVYSQVPLHKEFSGVVPELASRKHLETIHPVIQKAMEEAETGWNEIDAIAVTREPGLMGSLLLGLTVAKTLAYSRGKPLIPVNHIMAHMYAANLENSIAFPFIGLIVSGGHTLLTLWSSWVDYEILGTTIDDAVGEAYDKTAKLMGLGYPGGPVIDKMYHDGNPDAVDLPLVMLNKDKDRYNFSYSGLKTAVVYYVQKNPGFNQADLAASFQKKAIDVLYKKTLLACEDRGINRVVIAGGVAANSCLREKFNESDLEVYIPSLKLCTDNAAMVAGLAYHLYERGGGTDFTLDAVDKVITKDVKKKLRE